METSAQTENLLNLNELNELANPEAKNSGEVVFISGVPEKTSEENIDLVAMNIANSFDSLTFENVAKEGLSEPQIDLVVDKILSAITDMANIQYKGTSYIEPREINQVKELLVTENCDATAKQQIEAELTKFQEKINSDYKQQRNIYFEKKLEFEEELISLEAQKSKIVSARLSRMLWPFNEKTRMYDSKIYNVKCKIKACENKLASIESMRPAAKEKDILMFKMQMKEKFTT